MKITESTKEKVRQMHKLCGEILEELAQEAKHQLFTDREREMTEEDKLDFLTDGVFSMEFGEVATHLRNCQHTLDTSHDDIRKIVEKSEQTIDEAVEALKKNMVLSMLTSLLN